MIDTNIIKDYRDFNAEGLSSKLTPEEVETIKKINTKLSYYQKRIEETDNKIAEIRSLQPLIEFTTTKGETYVRKALAVDSDFSSKQLAKIFSHGQSDYDITFRNIVGKPCVITDAHNYSGDKVFVDVLIGVYKDKKGTPTSMSLDRFLYLVEKGDFRITNKDFVQYYMKPYSESIKTTKGVEELEQVKEQYLKLIKNLKNTPEYKYFDDLYDQAKVDITKQYKDEASVKIRDMAPSPASREKKEKSMNQKALDMKNIWNSTISPAEKALFIGWLCKHIQSIKIKTVEGGNSDAVISAAYPDSVYGRKYREKPNTSGWDASSGIMYFDDVTNAPEDIIKKLSTQKHLNHTEDKDTVFKGNMISNLDLVLFILNKYQKYGFRTAEPNLNKIIDVENLKNKEFNSFEKEFTTGYES